MACSFYYISIFYILQSNYIIISFTRVRKQPFNVFQTEKRIVMTILFQFCRDKEFGGYYAGKIDTKIFLLKIHTLIFISCNGDLTTCRSVSLSC